MILTQELFVKYLENLLHEKFDGYLAVRIYDEIKRHTPLISDRTKVVFTDGYTINRIMFFDKLDIVYRYHTVENIVEIIEVKEIEKY